MKTDQATSTTPQALGSTDELGLADPERAMRPALGYKYHADLLRTAPAALGPTADFIEAQNAEIEYLYAALQRVRGRVCGSRRSALAMDVLKDVDAALKYEA